MSACQWRQRLCCAYAGGERAGFGYLLMAILTVWATDTGAYYGGKALGKRKLAPTGKPEQDLRGGDHRLGFWRRSRCCYQVVGRCLTVVAASWSRPQPYPCCHKRRLRDRWGIWRNLRSKEVRRSKTPAFSCPGMVGPGQT